MAACGLATCDILAHDPAAVCVIAADDLTVAYANPACLDLVHCAAQEVRGRPVSELLPAGCEALVDFLMAARDASTAASLGHFRWASSTGDERVWSVGLAPRLHPRTGQVAELVVFISDVTEHGELVRAADRAAEQERQRAREARTLYHAARTISSDLNLQECLNIIAGAMAEAVGVSRCHIVLLEQETAKGVAAFGVSPEEVKRLEARVVGSPGLSACSRRVIEERRPVWVEDAAADPLSDQERIRGINMKSVLIVPLIYGSRVTGLAYLDEPGARREFGASDHAMAMAIAAQAAVAMENARLYEAEQERARMLEFMMAELNHRVKNNLAIVCGLLALQLTESDPAATKESVLRDCMTRIQSISLIHQILHEDNLDAVEMKETARRIAAMACDTLAAPGQRITFRVRGDRLMLPCKLATSLGVAVNELICNAVKHGFAGRARGSIAVRISVRDRIRISVRDDGRGLAPGFDPRRDAHVGVTVISGLVEGELGGSFTLRDNARGGAAAVLVFPAAALCPRG